MTLADTIKSFVSWRPDPTRPVKSILDQGWRAGFFEFPFRHKTHWFNPGLVEWSGALWLVTRRRRYGQAPGKNDITLWQIQDGYRLSHQELQIKFPVLYSNEHWEDPRAYNVDGDLWISYSNFRHIGFQYVHQAMARVNGRLQAFEIHSPTYGNNGPVLHANTGHEKNWTWFWNDGWKCVYSPSPHEVFGWSGDSVTESWEADSFSWEYGHVRGGTPPVLYDGLFWSFFHSSLELPQPDRRRYYIGAYAFEPWAPFRPVAYTPKPILCASEADPRVPGAPICVFPCGALPRGDTWLVTLGVNDGFCAWLEVPHKRLTGLVKRI